nr:PREDICTED: kelch-like protein 8 [Bemisia tabaci]XP_018916481.1 PREDICTED: kelch-like protein 8 [Bemisia tabaci]
MEAEESVESLETDELSSYRHRDFLGPVCLTNNLWSFKEQNLFCDVAIRVKGHVINAHKIVLAAATPYFKTMFTSGLKESMENVIEMHEVEFSLMQDIIQFFYTAQIELNETNVFDFWNMANFLQSTHLRGACKQYLFKEISTTNCLGIYEHALLYNELDFSDFCFQYILTHFQGIIKTNEFCHTSFKTLHKVLSSKVVNVLHEADLYKAIKQWVMFDYSNREEFIQPLLQRISILKILDSDLEDLLRENSSNDLPFQQFLLNLREIRQKIRYNDAENCDKEIFKTMKSTFRCCSIMNVIFAIGGMSATNVPLRNVECVTVGWEHWKCVRPTITFHNGRPQQETKVIPTMSQARHYPGIAVHDDCLYVLGGNNNDVQLASVEMYSVASNEWRELPPMPITLAGCAATCYNGTAYVCGGVIDMVPNTTSLILSSELLAFDISKKIWTKLAPMIHARCFHQLVVARNMLFAIGGQDMNEEPLSSVECYDFETNSWIEAIPMHEPRSHFGCVASDGYIYAVGGKTHKRILATVERYDVFLNQWVYKRSLSVARFSMGVTLSGSRVYCCGGEDELHRTLSTVEKYNILTDRWHSVLSMQCPRFGLVAASILLPALDEAPP